MSTIPKKKNSPDVTKLFRPSAFGVVTNSSAYLTINSISDTNPRIPGNGALQNPFVAEHRCHLSALFVGHVDSPPSTDC